MSGSADILIAILAGALVTAAAGLAVRLAEARLVRAMRRVQPEPRAPMLLAVLVAPMALGLFAAAVTAFLPLSAPFNLVPHHCHVDAAGCIAHEPAAPTVLLTVLGSGLTTAVVLWIVFSVLDFCLRTADARRLLMAVSDGQDGSSVRILRTDAVVALAGGILRTRLFVSRGLRDRLDSDETEIVLLHEEAHGRRRDNFVRLMGAVLTPGHFARTARVLRAELALAQEQACDRVAARRYGAVRAAETLLKVERLRGTASHGACFGAAYLDAPIAARVRALIAPDFVPAGKCSAVLGLIVLACLCAILLGSEPLHHELETYLLNIRH